jgi:hypothetical protein
MPAGIHLLPLPCEDCTETDDAESSITPNIFFGTGRTLSAGSPRDCDVDGLAGGAAIERVSSIRAPLFARIEAGAALSGTEGAMSASIASLISESEPGCVFENKLVRGVRVESAGASTSSFVPMEAKDDSGNFGGAGRRAATTAGCGASARTAGSGGFAVCGAIGAAGAHDASGAFC